jgi:serine protease AprX
MRRLFVSSLLCFIGFVLLVCGVGARTPRGSTTKIAPWLAAQASPNEPIEFLVVLGDQANLAAAKSLRTKTEKGHFVRDALLSKAQQTQAPLLKWLQDRHIEHRAFYIVNAIWVKASLAVAEQIAARPDVVHIEANPQIHNAVEPTTNARSTMSPDAVESIEPGVSYTHAPTVWAMGYTGQGIVVAGADTGYRWDHDALKNHYRGWNGTSVDHNYNWHDSVHENAGANSCGHDSATPCDDNSHGTHTIGTAVGDDGGANQIGMAPGAKWIGCRNMDANNGTPARYIECMQFFLAPYPIGGDPSQGDASKAPDLSTNSWGCPSSEGCPSTLMQQAVEAQRAAGIMFVASAGNGGPTCSSVSDPPGLYDAAYSIGALNTGADTIASFSSRGPVTADNSLRMKPDICAPGTNTRSSLPGATNSYGTKSGTSMAAPHVAGAIALLWSAQPGLRHDVSRTESILNGTAVHLTGSTCDLPTATPNNTFGYGRIDIKAAVDGAQVRLLGLTSDAGGFSVSFYAVEHMTYRLERKIDMLDSDWQSIAGVSDFTASTTGTASIVDPTSGSETQAFYRVRMLP